MEESTRSRTIDELARKVIRLGLETPALLFLEMHLPILGLAHASALVAQPLLTPFFGAERIHTLSQILSDRKNVEALIARIEELAALPRGSEGAR